MASSLFSRRDPNAPKSRRFIEIVLLVLAVGISSGALYLRNPEEAFGSSSSAWLMGTVVLGVGALILHVVLGLRARYADPFILPIVIVLNGIGLAMIYRIDSDLKYPVGDSQLFWTGLSMLACAVVIYFLQDHRVLRKVTYISLALSLILLVLPLLPIIGQEINGARIWISIAGRTFQPGEVAKITLRFSSPGTFRPTAI